LRKRLIAAQMKSEWLILPSVEDFLGRHGHGDLANEIRHPRNSKGHRIPDKTFYGPGSGYIKKGRLIQLLKQHGLWDIYVEEYWPDHRSSIVKYYLKRAAEWEEKYRGGLKP